MAKTEAILRSSLRSTRNPGTKSGFPGGRCGLYSPRSVLTLTRSASEGHNLFPRLRFGLVSFRAPMPQFGPLGV
jgi:hypothetical protein